MGFLPAHEVVAAAAATVAMLSAAAERELCAKDWSHIYASPAAQPGLSVMSTVVEVAAAGDRHRLRLSFETHNMRWVLLTDRTLCL
jgi:hypothetical protein